MFSFDSAIPRRKKLASGSKCKGSFGLTKMVKAVVKN
jgi:hypothetical protein